MTSRTDIVDGYTWILGRVPPDEEVEAAYGCFAAEDRHTFQHSLLASEEFRARRIHAAQRMRMEPVDLSRPKLIFLHIEKCGGTTLRTMLQAGRDPARLCPERFNGLGDWTGNELAAYDLFAGHFDLATVQLIPGERNAVVAMLREPRSRLLSLYHFWRAHRPHPSLGPDTLVGLARGCTAAAFFGHPRVVRHPDMRDAMTAQLIRPTGRFRVADRFPVLDEEDLILAAPEACLDAAWSKLTALAGFGLVEAYDLSRRVLNRALGLDMQPTQPRQVLRTLTSDRLEAVRPPPGPTDARLDALLDDLTRIDRALYARAATLFQERSAGY